ncbi:MAG: dihydropteroate synthase [Ignavibacteriaceae bacterium]|jgi:dihydropteroate synthase|nr:dihydropteroate synthase [Ignavibacteriaceae bacterium]
MLSTSKYKFSSSEIDFRIPVIMGVVNVTPDSFSDGGKYFSTKSAVDHALKLIDQGAVFIDIGGESTRPCSEPVSVQEEINRTIPVIKEIKKLRNDIIISIDTTKSQVAAEALDSGAEIVNDISGFTFDENIINVIKEYNPVVVIMHIKGNPKTMQDNPFYEDVVKEVKGFLNNQIKKIESAGLSKIIIDPGIGFGKRVIDNFQIIKHLPEFETLGYPIMIGVSRKFFLRKTLKLDINNVEVATVIMESLAVMKSARIIRTHNVEYCSQLVKLVNNII